MCSQSTGTVDRPHKHTNFWAACGRLDQSPKSTQTLMDFRGDETYGTDTIADMWTWMNWPLPLFMLPHVPPCFLEVMFTHN